MKTVDLFLSLDLSRSSHQRESSIRVSTKGEPSVGEARVREACIGETSRESSIWDTCREPQGVGIGSIEGSHSIGSSWEGSSWGSSKNYRLRDDMDRGRGLHISVDRGQGSMLSSLSSSKGSSKLSLGSSYLRGVLNRGGRGNSK